MLQFLLWAVWIQCKRFRYQLWLNLSHSKQCLACGNPDVMGRAALETLFFKKHIWHIHFIHRVTLCSHREHINRKPPGWRKHFGLLCVRGETGVKKPLGVLRISNKRSIWWDHYFCTLKPQNQYTYFPILSDLASAKEIFRYSAQVKKIHDDMPDEWWSAWNGSAGTLPLDNTWWNIK